MLDFNEAGMNTFCEMGFDFWWNWDHVPTTIYSNDCAWKKFVPMIWGVDPGNSRIAKTAAARLMGYNEPDLWGPPAVPGADYLASGSFAPTFHCGSEDLANNWQEYVMAYKATHPTGQVFSPSMADADPEHGASAGPFADCNQSPQTPGEHMPFCPGWLKCFKENVKQKSCGETDCWEVIDVLQFHAYAYTAEEVIQKIASWETVWAEDLSGASGKKKSLWLTEVARAGAVDSADPDGKTRAFMQEIVEYMRGSPSVSGWSWFSQDSTSFASFEINGIQPETATWASELIDKDGQATEIGKFYAELCKQR